VPEPSSKRRSEAGRPRSLRDEQRDFTRGRLRDAALEVIARTGYPAATIDEIAATAGASRATFYLHFRSKADLIRELVEMMPDRQHIWDGLNAMRNPSRAEVRSWLDGVIRMYDTNRLYFLAVEQAVAVEPELTEDYYRQSDEYLDEAAPAFPENIEDARLRLMLLWVQLSRFCFLWRVRGMKLDETRTMGLLTDIWHEAMNP
jgi:AcrR family transcriptional regulator